MTRFREINTHPGHTNICHLNFSYEKELDTVNFPY